MQVLLARGRLFDMAGALRGSGLCVTMPFGGIRPGRRWGMTRTVIIVVVVIVVVLLLLRLL
jgi:hypothetical protein